MKRHTNLTHLEDPGTPPRIHHQSGIHDVGYVVFLLVMVANQPLFDWKVVKSKRGRYNGQSPGRMPRILPPEIGLIDFFFQK